MYGEFLLIYCIWTGGSICGERKDIREDLVFESEELCEEYANGPQNRAYILKEYSGLGENVYVIPGCQSNLYMTEPEGEIG